MLRDIRGVQQHGTSELRRWFQDRYFDLFLTQNRAGELQWFQLCYARDTWRERVLEWRRGRGFQHLRVKQPLYAAAREAGVLVRDGVMPYLDVAGEFKASAAGLPEELARLIAGKIDEYARPARRFRKMGARTPRWMERLRERAHTEARLRALEGSRGK